MVAFPAGNSGAGLWFDHLATPVHWQVSDAGVTPLTDRDARGRALHGVQFTASAAVPRLTVKQALLGSVRFLRDYQAVGRFPVAADTPVQWSTQGFDLRRDRADGAPGYRLHVDVIDGRVDHNALVAGAKGRITLRVTALTGETPLHGLAAATLLNADASVDPAARQSLTFLSTQEKFLAGSWRFDTYFGRDTLLSVQLLMPVLKPAAIEAGLGAVLARLDGGQVAHEEGIGEFAVIDNRAHGRAGDAPDLDYKMIDGNYLLAPVAANYLLGPAGMERARRFLARSIADERHPGTSASAGRLLVSNLRYVLATARPFAQAPGVSRLIALKPGFKQGQWRDSDDGLGGGRYAYDVNAVLVPAALEATQRLLAAGLLDPYLRPVERSELAKAPAAAAVWRARAPALFSVTESAATTRAAIVTYAAEVSVPIKLALATIPARGLTFHALALNADGTPVPVINSDESFDLLFGEPRPAELTTAVHAMMRPFPAGLMTPVGLLVANPVFAPADWRTRFSGAAYHGTVVWSWQQALLAAGLQRQLARDDLPAPVRATLVAAQAQLWRAITATRAYGNSELWSWAYRDGDYRVVPFGAGANDVDESNAAQLWSTVYLAVRPPPGIR